MFVIVSWPSYTNDWDIEATFIDSVCYSEVGFIDSVCYTEVGFIDSVCYSELAFIYK